MPSVVKDGKVVKDQSKSTTHDSIERTRNAKKGKSTVHNDP